MIPSPAQVTSFNEVALFRIDLAEQNGAGKKGVSISKSGWNQRMAAKGHENPQNEQPEGAETKPLIDNRG